MKLLLMLFCFLCIQTTRPVKGEPKKSTVQKKEAKASLKFAPSLIIINY